MSQQDLPLPGPDELAELRDGQDEATQQSVRLHQQKVEAAIRKAAADHQYWFWYHFDERYQTTANNIKFQVRDWVRGQDGYSARVNGYGALVVKIPKPKKSRQWPFFLRWIPGLGG